MSSKFDEELTNAFLKSKCVNPIVNVAEDDSVLHYVGDITGKRVLDLGCGEGSCARLMKMNGADLVVGVDMSEQIIKIAQEKEAENPLGIEYYVRDGRTMEKIGEFDIVVANFLLYYADNVDELQNFANVIYKNLVSGGKFVSYTLNVAKTKWSPPAQELVGLNIKELNEIANGWLILLGCIPTAKVKIDFRVVFLHPHIYKQVFAKAGFIKFSFLPPFLSKATLDSFPKGYWDPLLKDPIINVISAQK